jgi:hypothetical protein
MSDVTIEDTCLGLAAVLASEIKVNEDPVDLKARLDEAAALMTSVHQAHEEFKVAIAAEITRQMTTRQDVLRGAGLVAPDSSSTAGDKPKKRGRKPKSEKLDDANGHVQGDTQASALHAAPTFNA